MARSSLQKRIFGWMMFDWASQPYHTVLLTFIFGPFFASIAAEYYMGTGLDEKIADANAQWLWSMCLTVSGLIIGFGAPLLGAIADTSGNRMPWIVGFSLMYFIGAAALWYTDPLGSNLWWALFAFGFGFIGAEYALIFINAQLPSLGSRSEIGQISGSGFAFGYLGGLCALAISLTLLVEQPSGKTLLGIDPILGLSSEHREGTRATGPFAAIWFALFMVPYFIWVRETRKRRSENTFSDAFAMLKKSIVNLKHRTSLATYLGSSMLYRDALNGLYSFGGTYALLVLNLSISQVGLFGIVGAISAAVMSYFGGRADKRYGPKPVIILAIFGLIVACILLLGMSPEMVFWISLNPGSPLPLITFFFVGILVGGLGGVMQSASRSMMVRHCDPDAPTESFGLYGLSGRATAFIAPALIGTVTALTQNARYGVLPLIILFLIGLFLLKWVNAEGEEETKWSTA